MRETAEDFHGHYPEGVISDEDKQEYDAFAKGLPIVNEVSFGHSFTAFRNWIGDGCPAKRLPAMKGALKTMASYIAQLDEPCQANQELAEMLTKKSEEESPTLESMENALKGILDWAS